MPRLLAGLPADVACSSQCVTSVCGAAGADDGHCTACQHEMDSESSGEQRSRARSTAAGRGSGEASLRPRARALQRGREGWPSLAVGEGLDLVVVVGGGGGGYGGLASMLGFQCSAGGTHGGRGGGWWLRSAAVGRPPAIWLHLSSTRQRQHPLPTASAARAPLRPPLQPTHHCRLLPSRFSRGSDDETQRTATIDMV